MLLALITNSLIYKQKSKHDVHPCPAEKKRTNRIGNTETETQQPWFSVPTRNQNPVSVIHYYYQVFNSTCCQRKKRQYTKTLLLIYYYYGKKEIKRQKCCGNFFHLKIKKSNQKQDKGSARFLVSRDF